jgi:hypothetical protein
MFFPLTKAAYEKSNYEQAAQKLTAQIKDFSSTEIFKNFHSAHPGPLYFNRRDISP